LLAGFGDPPGPSASEDIDQARASLAEGQPRAAVIALKNAIQGNPRDPQSRLLLAQAYLDLLQGAAAEAELRKAQDLGMDTPELVSALGRALLMQGRFQDALSLEYGGLAAPSRAAELRAIRGDAALGLGERDRARSLYGEALASDPGNARAQVGMARLALSAGQPEKARRRLQPVLDSGQAPVTAWTLLGDLELSEGRAAEAERAYGRAVDASPVAGGAFQLKRAQARILLGDITGAREDLAAVKTRVRNHPEVSFIEGLLALREGHLREARSALETVLTADPGHTGAAYALGVLLFEREEWARSAEYLSRIGADFPYGEQAKRMLAYARLRSGDLDGTERALEELSAEAPDPGSDLLGLLARIKVARGELEEGQALIERASETDDPSIKGLDVDLGLQLLRAGEVEAGLEQLEGTVERRPESVRARRVLFVARLQAGDRAGAQTVVDEMRSRWPDDPLALVLQGVLDLAAGDRALAKQHLGEALALDPANPAAALPLAQLAIAEGRQTRARELYAAVLDAHPDHLPTRIALALLERRAGDEAAFETRLSGVLADHPGALRPRLLLAQQYLLEGAPDKALTLLKGAEGRGPDNPALLAMLARSYLADGNRSEAKTAGERLVALAPKSADARYLLARIYAETGDRQGLRRELLAALDLDPANPASDGLINQLVSASPTLEEAKRVLGQLRARYPDHPRFLRQRAQDAIERGAVEEALGIYRRAAELYPADARWPLRLSELHRNRGEPAAAVEVLEKRLAQRPGELPVRLALANLYLSRGDADRAMADFREVLERDPDNVPALNNLAWLLSAQSPEEARDYAERAAELAGESPAVKDTLGLVLLRQRDDGELDRARRLLIDAAAEMPDSPEVRFHLAMAWSRSGEPAKAAAILEPLLATEDEFPGRSEAADLLERVRSESP
jgi:putative PEP-CTERM system TPR-repeat lipoprotein